MNRQERLQKSKEFDRQIREARLAAHYSLSVEEELSHIARVKTLQAQKEAFRKLDFCS
jgi:hypothetical protein